MGPLSGFESIPKRAGPLGETPRLHEGPSFVGRCNLVFPPGVNEPDRAADVTAEGVWIVRERPGFVSYGGCFPELRARRVEERAWASSLRENHRRVLGMPLPDRLLELVDRGDWKLGSLADGRMLCATGWARTVDTFLDFAEIEAHALRVRAMNAAEKRRRGFLKDAPRSLDAERTLIVATNPDDRMLALDYRRDPPEVMYSEEAHGELRWRRLAGDFDAFADGYLVGRLQRRGESG